MIELNWTLLVQMINFLILMVVLDKILYKPILKILDERDERISGGQEKTKDLQERGDVMFKEYNAKLHDAKVDALSVQSAARKEAQTDSNAIIDEARKQAEDIVAEMRVQMAQEIERAKQEIEPELKELAATIAQQVLGRKVA